MWTTWQWIVTNSAGLQAVGAVVAAFFAVVGFGVLCVYAYDTKTIARATSNQAKDALMPFISLDLTPDDIHPNALIWKMHSQGSGLGVLAGTMSYQRLLNSTGKGIFLQLKE
jgi:hypothetical protein